MSDPLPVTELLDEWLRWATWISAEDRNESDGDKLIGHSEFTYVAEEHPEHCWSAITSALADSNHEPYLGLLAAGPLEDLLSYHGSAYIERVEKLAKSNSAFAELLGGLYQFKMSDEIWERVRKASA